ncbi:translation initiation factor IF-3 [candidate division KSB1 bacterium]|nr:translation initiation factor IF-3 [candidate division KSB1 bacterium]TDI81208.1 MAG: translation initiation factor IF-3 [Caldithrix sp.]TDI98221.1 MAG: translation initiation factor IF-3 [Caldithrix sp.]
MNKKKQTTAINDRIKAPEVRVIDVSGEQVGVINTSEAIEMARSLDLDLVEISPNASPPVCQIMDYGKYKYQQSKKEKDTKKKQHVVHLKEIRLRPKIEAHDFNFKIDHARKFLEKGNKVKATVLFRGREMAHKEFAKTLLERMANELEDIAKIEREAVMEGRLMIMYLTKK